MLLGMGSAKAQWALPGRDSIIALLNPKERSAEQLHRYNLLANSWMLSKKANRYLPHMDTIARALATHPDERLRWHATVRRSIYHYMMGYQAKFDRNVPKALWHFERSCALLDSIGSGDDIARNLQAIGTLYYSAGEHELAWKYFTDAFSLALRDDPGDPENQHNIRTSMAAWLAERGELDRADSVLKLCDTSMVDVHILVLTLRARIHEMQGEPTRAEATYLKALIRAKDGVDEWASIDVLTHLARMRSRLGDHRGTLEASEHCVEVAARTGDEAAWCTCMIIGGQARLAMGDVLNAELALQAALDTARAYGYIGLSRETGDEGSMMNAAGLLKDLYLRNGRFREAVEMSTYWSMLKDTLNRMDGRLEVLRHRMKREALEDSLEAVSRLALAECQREEAVERAAIDRHRAIVMGTMAILVALVALLLYRVLRNRQRLARQQNELLSKHVDQILAQQELKSINAMLDGQEKERDRMGRELHDRLGSMLGGIKANMAALEDRVEAMRQDQQYQKVNRLLDQTVSELRQISHDMAAATLNRFGLEKALKDLRDTLHISGRLQVELNTFGLDQRLERSVEIAVYRIIQELVSNVLKHAKASELTIGVTRAPGRLSMVVSDNGVGFDPGSVSGGMGLRNVRSRATAIGATVQVDSTPGKGTTVSVECVVVE